MQHTMTIDTNYLTNFYVGLLNTPSPTGDTEAVGRYRTRYNSRGETVYADNFSVS